jgi:predicted transcriptional regulator
MRVCRVKVRIEPEEMYWKGQVQRFQEIENDLKAGQRLRVQGSELVFASLTDMARTLTPKRLDLLRLLRRQRPSSVRALAQLAGRDPKNVLADVKVLETLGLIEDEGERKERHRKTLRTDFGRIEVHVEL